MTFDLHFYPSRTGSRVIRVRPLTARGATWLADNPPPGPVNAAYYNAARASGLQLSFETVEIRDELTGA